MNIPSAKPSDYFAEPTNARFLRDIADRLRFDPGNLFGRKTGPTVNPPAVDPSNFPHPSRLRQAWRWMNGLAWREW